MWNVKPQFRGLVVIACLLTSYSALAESRFISSRGSVGILRDLNGRQRFVDLNQVKDLPGSFSRIKQLGNDLVELNTDAFGNAVVSQLFINGVGQLVGATNLDTIKQAKDFYLTNFNKFNGAAAQAVNRFLVANGGAQNLRGFTIDLANSVVPQEEKEIDGKKRLVTKAYAQGKEQDVKLAALNFLINMISQSADIFTVNPGLVRGGQVGVNLLRFMKPEAIALLTGDNPYACSGTGADPFRVDLLISRAMDPDVYNRLTGAPDKFDELTRQFGISENRRDYPGRHIIAGGAPGVEESIVGRHPQRILGFREQLNVGGEDAYVSYDNRYNLPNGAQSDSANAFDNGIDTSFEAGEMIFRKPNGFPFFYLATNPGGNRARSAPNEFARATISTGLSRREGHSSDVSSPINCLECHANGILGGGISLATGKEYSDNLRLGKIRKTQQFFTTNQGYQSHAVRTNTIWRNSLVAAGAFIPDPESPIKNAFPGQTVPAALLPDMVGEYNAPLTVEKAAEELKVPAASLAGLLRTTPDGKVSRKEFEKQFCLIKSRLGGGGVGLASTVNVTGAFSPLNSVGSIGINGLNGVSHIR